MLTFLGKIRHLWKRLKGGADAVVSTPFQLTCECGATVRGVRRSTWIESECPSCCHSVFVLPANVYPATRLVPSTVVGGSFPERLKARGGRVVASTKTKGRRKARRGSGTDIGRTRSRSGDGRRCSPSQAAVTGRDSRIILTNVFAIPPAAVCDAVDRRGNDILDGSAKGIRERSTGVAGVLG